MQSVAVLDILERLRKAAGHPDIVKVERYGQDPNPGVAVTYQSGSAAYLWITSAGRSEPTPHDLPDELPPLKFRGKDGATAYLRVTSGSGPMGDPDSDQHPDYVIPEGLKS